MVHLSYAVNAVLGSSLIIALIFADYVRKYNTDAFQRRIFLNILIFSFTALMGDFVYYVLEGRPGEGVRSFFYFLLTAYYFFQVAAFFYIFIFIDYMSFKDHRRTKKLSRAVWALLFIHLGILILNLSGDFYFYVGHDNVFSRGDRYVIRLVFSYFPAALALGDLFFSVKNFKKTQLFLILFFLFFTGAGSTIDILFNTGVLIWPCFTSVLLYAYFFIVRTDSKIDSLTGIGNRYSFNEFIDNLVKQNTRQSYAVVMIDVDHFKQINDTLGHPEGDNALRDLAAIIKGCIRHSDFAARYGGDEFILAARAEYNIEKLIGRIQEAIKIQNDKNVRPYKIEISYGCDIFTTNSGQSIESFLTHIDALMYKHKAERRRQEELREK